MSLTVEKVTLYIVSSFVRVLLSIPLISVRPGLTNQSTEPQVLRSRWGFHTMGGDLHPGMHRHRPRIRWCSRLVEGFRPRECFIFSPWGRSRSSPLLPFLLLRHGRSTPNSHLQPFPLFSSGPSLANQALVHCFETGADWLYAVPPAAVATLRPRPPRYNAT